MAVRNTKGFINAYTKAEYWWEPLDRPILTACRMMPNHVANEEVFAKIALVNRVYRANLHLGTTNAEWKLAELLVRMKFDNTIAQLRKLKSFSNKTKASVIAAHEDFVKIAYKVTKRVENSFCAKYLSSHFPAVLPIFDSKSYATSWKLKGGSLGKDLYDNNRNCDYGYHCEAILLLITDLRREGISNPNLKLIDSILYESGR
jgi:hypothetical protein